MTVGPEHHELNAPNWWVCQYPERPVNDWAVYRLGCHRCLIVWRGMMECLMPPSS